MEEDKKITTWEHLTWGQNWIFTMQGQLTIFGNRPQAYASKNLFANSGLWKKKSRLNVQVIISTVTLCEKKKRQNFAQLVGVVFAHGETSSWERIAVV